MFNKRKIIFLLLMQQIHGKFGVLTIKISIPEKRSIHIFHLSVSLFMFDATRTYMTNFALSLI